jgi:hypothetical protein
VAGRREWLKGLARAHIREGDHLLWAEQVNGRYWLHDGDVGRQFFMTNASYMEVGSPCPQALPNEEQEPLDLSLPKESTVMLKDVVTLLAGSDKIWISRNGRKGFHTIVGQV